MTIKLGFLGAAEISKKNARAVLKASDAIELVAVGSRDISKAEAFIKEHCTGSSAKAYGTYQAVLDLPEVDAVYIPLPTGLHVEWVEKAAAAGKHILLEKPIALTKEDLAAILASVSKHGVQLMDGTMWTHSPRATMMKEAIQSKLGPVLDVKSTLTLRVPQEFMAGNVRSDPKLDGLGSLGDLGWYCTRGILWAMNWELPAQVAAHHGAQYNSAGVLTYCGGTLLWEGTPQRRATFTASFDQTLNQELCVSGEKAVLRLNDFVIPHNEAEQSFSVAMVDGIGFNPTATGTTVSEEKHLVSLSEPQETCMWREFARCVESVKGGGPVATFWHEIAEKTQKVVHALAASLAQGCKLVPV